MSLQAKLDAFKAHWETQVAPADAVAALHRQTDELIASGQANRALKAGDRAPEFALPDADGHAVSSKDLLVKGPLVVTFYRGVWCPYCNIDLQALEEAVGGLRDLGANLVAVSEQTATFSRKAQRDNKLTFPILSDAGGDVAHAFGLRYAMPDYLIGVYKGFKLDLAEINGDASWTLPIPGRYVIGQDGVIVYAEVNPDYTTRPDPGELLPVLASLRAKAA